MVPAITPPYEVNHTGRADDPHAGFPILSAGPVTEEGRATLILIHGRGASAESVLSLYKELGLYSIAALAPQAARGSWYPESFLAPLDINEPWLTSALKRIDDLMHDLMGRHIPSAHIALLGFSQGACLACEYVARHPRRYGGLFALTGGLIGPPGTDRFYMGSLEGTPVFLGTSDPDPHVPLSRVEETRAVLSAMGANVELRSYPGMPHTINEDELSVCQTMLEHLASEVIQEAGT